MVVIHQPSITDIEYVETGDNKMISSGHYLEKRIGMNIKALVDSKIDVNVIAKHQSIILNKIVEKDFGSKKRKRTIMKMNNRRAKTKAELVHTQVKK